MVLLLRENSFCFPEWVFRRAQSEAVIFDRESGPTLLSFVTGACPRRQVREYRRDGKVWIDTTDKQDMQPKHISGKYKINLNGMHLEGTLLAKRHVRRGPLRSCM